MIAHAHPNDDEYCGDQGMTILLAVLTKLNLDRQDGAALRQLWQAGRKDLNALAHFFLFEAGGIGKNEFHPGRLGRLLELQAASKTCCGSIVDLPAWQT